MPDRPTTPPAADPAPAAAADPPAAGTPLLLSGPAARRFLGVGRTKWFALKARPGFALPVNISGTAMWLPEELRAWRDRQPRMKRRRRVGTANDEQTAGI